MFVREENNARILLAQNFGDDGDGFFPVGAIELPGFGVHFFEAVRFGLDEAVADVIAGALEFFEAGALAFFVAALSNGDVDDVEMGFAHDAKGQGADDAFVIRMRRKNEGARGILIDFGAIEWSEAAEGRAFAGVEKFGVLVDEMMIRVHSA